MIAKESEEKIVIVQYDLTNYLLVQEFEVAGEFVKGNIIEQNDKGNIFSLMYIDNGNWHLLVFDFDKIIDNFDINKNFSINNYTLPITGFNQPFATCCFMDDFEIFVNFFHRPTKMHYHFTYNPKEKKVN